MNPIKMEQIWPEKKDTGLEEMVFDVSYYTITNQTVNDMMSIMSRNPEGRKLRVTFDSGQVCTYKERTK